MNKKEREKLDIQIDIVSQEIQTKINDWVKLGIEPGLISEIGIAELLRFTRKTAPCFHALINKIGSSIQTAADLMAHDDHEDENAKC